MDIKELKDIALELMDALAAKKLGEVELELDNAKIKIKADEPPFVLVGQQVKEGDTLCIIEAMKIMNEIKAPCDGKVIRIMAQPGDMVEYNQVLCVIE